MAIHSSIPAWRIPWTEKPGGLQSKGRKESDTTGQLSMPPRLLSSQTQLPSANSGPSLKVVFPGEGSPGPLRPHPVSLFQQGRHTAECPGPRLHVNALFLCLDFTISYVISVAGECALFSLLCCLSPRMVRVRQTVP